jgi:hypothetical protein
MNTNCSKNQYASKKDATTAMNWRIKGRRKNRHGRPDTLRIYQCPTCGQWHMTHGATEIKRYHATRKPTPEEVPDEYQIL